MDLCVLHQDGAILVHRNMPAGPEPFLKAVAPSRTDLVVCVECIFTWYWLADLGARAGRPGILGHALSLQAMHGGQAQNDNIEAQTLAGLLRGALLPQAYGSPAERPAPRDLRRRRIHLMRTRAERLTPVQPTTSPYHVPESGNQSAYTTNRPGVAARFAAPAVPKSVAGHLALLDEDDQLRRALAGAIGTRAKPHAATTLSVRQTVPGLGKLLRLVLLDERHALARVPRVQDVVSSGRRVTGAQEAAGKRDGPAGTPSGHAELPWAVSAAAVWCLRNHPAGQTYLAR